MTVLVAGVKIGSVVDFTLNPENFQANVVDSAAGAPLRGYLSNVKEVKVRGAELDLSTRSIGGFTSYFNLAYTDAKYIKFVDAPCSPELAGGTVATGTQVPGAPGVRYVSIPTGTTAADSLALTPGSFTTTAG